MGLGEAETISLARSLRWPIKKQLAKSSGGLLGGGKELLIVWCHQIVSGARVVTTLSVCLCLCLCVSVSASRPPWLGPCSQSTPLVISQLRSRGGDGGRAGGSLSLSPSLSLSRLYISLVSSPLYISLRDAFFKFCIFPFKSFHSPLSHSFNPALPLSPPSLSAPPSPWDTFFIFKFTYLLNLFLLYSLRSSLPGSFLQGAPGSPLHKVPPSPSYKGPPCPAEGSRPGWLS